MLPIALVDETFRQNGSTTPGRHPSGPAEQTEGNLRCGRGAVYHRIEHARYLVIAGNRRDRDGETGGSESGTTLWTGSARASSEEGGNNGGGGLIGMLITAAVKQIIGPVRPMPVTRYGVASNRLLAGQHAGLLYSRSPKYGTD